MPQSYTVGGDTLQPIGWDYYAAQSFTPSQDHVLHHIDINLRTVHSTRVPDIKLYLADGNHKPTGPVLSDNIRAYSENWNLYSVFRCRTDMEPYPLKANIEYVIVIHAFAIDLAHHMQWQFDAGDASYARGIRLISTDGGITWALRPGDDHIFAEFGTPPAPSPPPPPPVYKFAPLDITYRQAAGGYYISLASNAPCHLWMRWTFQPPDKHVKSRISRGVALPWYTEYCFVVYKELEQLEPGDTLYHTFWFKYFDPETLKRQTIYFYFHGDIDAQKSTSTTAIFTKIYEHRYELYSPPWDSGWGIARDWLQSQSFTPDYDHQITKIHPWLAHRGGPCTIHAYIHRAGPYHCPVGDPLAIGKYEFTVYHDAWFYIWPTIPFTTFSQPIPPFDFYEPWGIGLTANNPWVFHHVFPQSYATVAMSQLNLHSDSEAGIRVRTDVLPAPLPLLDPSNNHLHVHYCSPYTNVGPVYGWATYWFGTEKDGEEFDIEPIVDRGSFWGPWDTHERQWDHVYAFDLGKGPGIFDLTQKWIRGRTLAGLPVNPSGWKLIRVSIMLEQLADFTTQDHVNNYLHIAYQTYPPAPSDDYPLKGTTLNLKAGQEYCIVLTQTPPGVAATTWRGTTSGTYPKGIHCKHDIPPEWVPQPGEDLNFSEWGIPPEEK